MTINLEMIISYENASSWAQSEEQYSFVCELLESIDLRATMIRVEYIEARFAEMLQK